MDEKIVQEILREVFASLEAVETKSAALLQFMKDKGIAKPEELEPYMEQAGNASSVRWLAARVRIEHLIAGAMKSSEQEAKKEAPQEKENAAEKTSDSEKAKALATKPEVAEAESDQGSKDKTEKSDVAAEAKTNPTENRPEDNSKANRNINDKSNEGAEHAA
jgi:hypothetical protein